MAAVWEFVVNPTDNQWFAFLAAERDLDEVNFWLPGAPATVNIQPGTPWLFKLKAPYSHVAGGGFFSYYTRLPIGVAWDTFRDKNGAPSLAALCAAIARNRKSARPQVSDDIGCVMLVNPFFFRSDQWIGADTYWHKNIQGYKKYSLSDPTAVQLWQRVQHQLQAMPLLISPIIQPHDRPSVGKPLLVTPRLGQGSFRAKVLDAYNRRCAVTGERTLPALQAAHIRPFSIVKTHEITNGLALRSDIHQLYDQGYVSVRPDLKFVVSPRIREEFENGRDYYALDGREVRVPSNPEDRPSNDSLDWHFSVPFLK